MRRTADNRARRPSSWNRKFGQWIRPVSRKGEGELSFSDIRFQNGELPKIFDVIDIPVEEHEVSASQPENWFINPQKHWIKVKGYEDDIPSVDTDSPPDLWIDPDGRDDRITPNALAKLQRGQSLYLIGVSQFLIKIEWHHWKRQHRRRALFQYRGRDYIDGGCLLCSEDKPHHCHRRLVAEYLMNHWGDVHTKHLG